MTRIEATKRGRQVAMQPSGQAALDLAPGPMSLSMPITPRLLIVDDEPLMAEYMASVADEAGWTVDLALTPAEFEAKIRADAPDMLVLDLAMPGRDGIELLRYLAENHYLGNLIIASACDGAIVETSAMLAREHGLALTGYLQKPIAAEDLTALLEQAVAMVPSPALGLPLRS
jgi:CheY-like chemotaxis protein